MSAEPPAESRDRRRRLRRTRRRAGAAQGRRRRDAGRPHQPPSVPAAAVPARVRHALDGRLRGPDPRDAAQAVQRERVDGRGDRDRPGAARTAARPRRAARLRQPDRRLRREHLVLRPRRMAGAVVRAQDARGRGRAAGTDPVLLRGGRARGRPGRARALLDHRGDRRRPDRRRGRRPARRAGASSPAAPVHALRSGATRASSCSTPANACSPPSARSCRPRPRASWRRSASTCARVRAPPRSMPPASPTSRAERPGGSRRRRSSGPPACTRRRSPARSPRPPGPSTIAAGGSTCSPTAACPDTRRSP